VQVPCDEGLAIHIGPESCAVAREGLGEALTGGCIGQPLSRESFLSWVPTQCILWKATRPARHRERLGDPAWSETLACADACPFRKVRFAHIDGVAHQGSAAR
jgi:hypothetical protein